MKITINLSEDRDNKYSLSDTDKFRVLILDIKEYRYTSDYERLGKLVYKYLNQTKATKEKLNE